MVYFPHIFTSQSITEGSQGGILAAGVEAEAEAEVGTVCWLALSVLLFTINVLYSFMIVLTFKKHHF